MWASPRCSTGWSGKRLALVDDQPGVTRDLREGAARLGDLRFTVIDTAGLEEATDDSLQGRMRKLTERAVDMADVCLFLIDARAGSPRPTRSSPTSCASARRHVILAANKAEGRAGEAGVLEAWALGLGEPVRCRPSMARGWTSLRPSCPAGRGFEARRGGGARDRCRCRRRDDAEVGPADPRAPRGKPLQIAVIGRPNAGKSTLVNAILGEDRLLTGPEAGITRDAISVAAGLGRHADAHLRHRRHAQEGAGAGQAGEALGRRRAARGAKFAEVVVVLLDAQIPFETQDLRIADLAEREGRAVVVAVNKWDLEDDRQAKLKRAARGVRAAAAAAARRAAGHGLGADGAGLDRLHAAILRRMRSGTGGADGAAQPVAGRHGRGASAPGAGRAADQAALHDAGQDAPAGLRRDVLAPRGAARSYGAISSTGCARPSTCPARRSG
jgi:GTPase